MHRRIYCVIVFLHLSTLYHTHLLTLVSVPIRNGHNKVSAMQLFPKSGHLILSSGMDGKVKVGFIWNICTNYVFVCVAVGDIQGAEVSEDLLGARQGSQGHRLQL